MDTTATFFRKLKKVAVTLESETAKLQRVFEKQNNDSEEEDSSTTAIRAFHEFNCDVQNLKGQLNDALADQSTHETEVRAFIKSCNIVEQQITEDISQVKLHWEKYGYQAPLAKKSKTSSTELKEEEEEEEDTDSGENISGVEEPEVVPQNPLRSPQMSDFGLSELQLKRKLATWFSDSPQISELNIPEPSLKTPEPPAMPLNPKCMMQTDDDELHTPQMVDFGITDQTMFLNNDFTMDLFRKDAKKSERSAPNSATTPVNNGQAVQVKVNEGSPEQAGVCTAGNTLPASPEIPAFKTPFLNRLATRTCPDEPEPDMSCRFDLQETPVGRAESPCKWEYNVLSGDDDPISAMPKLESELGNTLLSQSKRKASKTFDAEYVDSTDMDGPTQEFSLSSPQVKRVCPEPSTPEMPDLSSCTQDIFKLLSRAQSDGPKKSQIRAPKVVKQVTEAEFLNLPSYLRQMSLSNLNQTINNINQFILDCQGEKTEILTEELTRISKVGTKAPIHFLCLGELKRLILVGGAKNTAVYRLNLEI